MLFASSYSRFFNDYGAYFILLVGLVLTYVTAILNLNSTADMPFNWFFFEPFFYGAIIYLDWAEVLPGEQIVYLYIAFFVQTLVKYLWFMTSVISQLTDYLQINFLTVGGKGANVVSDNLMGNGKNKEKKK